MDLRRKGRGKLRTTGKGAEEAADYVSRVMETQSYNNLGSVLKHFPGSTASSSSAPSFTA